MTGGEGLGWEEFGEREGPWLSLNAKPRQNTLFKQCIYTGFLKAIRVRRGKKT